jgi:hypothetical protein
MQSNTSANKMESLSSTPTPTFYQINANITVNTSETGTKQVLQLTRDLLGISSTYKDQDRTIYPLICTNYRFNTAKLASLPYEKLISRFFVRARLSAEYLEPYDPNDEHDQFALVKRINFANMLVLLFPTTIPVMNYVNGSSTVDLQINVHWSQTWHNPYSYIVVQPNTYTITKTTWLNDIRNNPRYIALINQCKLFSAWRDAWISVDNPESNSELIKLYSIFQTEYIKNMPLPNSEPSPQRPGLFTSVLKRTAKKTPNSKGEEENELITEFRQTIEALDQMLKANVTGDKPDYDMFLKYMRVIKEIGNALDDTKTQKSAPLQRSIQELARFLNAYKLVESQHIALSYITNINVQYNLTELASYINDNYPVFATFSNEIRNFHAQYIIDNQMWKNPIDRIIQSAEPNLDKQLQLIVNMSNGNDESAQWVGFDLIKPGREIPVKGGATTINTTPILTAVVDLQMNVIDQKITSDNAHLITCPFNDYIIGEQFDWLKSNSENRIPPIQFFAAGKYLETTKTSKPKVQPVQNQPVQKEVIPLQVQPQKGGGFFYTQRKYQPRKKIITTKIRHF